MMISRQQSNPAAHLYVRFIQKPRSVGQDLVDLVEILQPPRNRSQALQPRGIAVLQEELRLLQVYKVATLVPTRGLKSHTPR